MSAKREPLLRLYDMLEAIDKILERVDEGFEAYLNDEMMQIWMVHHLAVIGEAATHVPKEIRDASPDIDWHLVTATRNRLVHVYFDVDLAAIWMTASRDLPILRTQISRIINGMQ